jgi:beta-N-acetylhexosaminidase
VTGMLPARGERARADGQQWRLPPWMTRAALVLALALLAVRAGLASAAFMAPGGTIAGWSLSPKTTCVLCNLKQPTPQATQQHQLTPKEYATFLAQNLPLDDALGQMIMIQFYTSYVSPELQQMINAQRVGGALLLGRPVRPADQTLNPQLQKLSGNGIPLFTTIDQEGGSVNRFWTIIGPLPSAGSLADAVAAQARGVQDANLLHTYGYNLNFAPMADLGAPNEDSQFYGRTFGRDPTRVATMAGAYLDGLQQSGYVIGCLKHFPGGLEATGIDPHNYMPVLNRSRADWEALDLAPYRALLQTGTVQAIMVSHEIVPAVDSKLPTSLSPAVITDTLRSELGFDGVVITDDLHMHALNQQWSVWDAGVLSVKAGADIIGQMATPYEVQQTLDGLNQAINSGQITRARINDSVRRILTLKIQMGLIAMPGKGSTPTRHASQQDGALPGALPVARLKEAQPLA